MIIREKPQVKEDLIDNILYNSVEDINFHLFPNEEHNIDTSKLNSIPLFSKDDRYFTDNKKEHGQYIIQFTQSEIDELPECYTHPAVWEQVEVKEHNKTDNCPDDYDWKHIEINEKSDN